MTQAEAQTETPILTLHSIVNVNGEIHPATVTVRLLTRLPRIVIASRLRPTHVTEIAERVRLAIGGAGFEFPRKRVVVDVEIEGCDRDLDLRPFLSCDGAELDTAIALGILAINGSIEADFSGRVFAGTLSTVDGVASLQRAIARATPRG